MKVSITKRSERTASLYQGKEYVGEIYDNEQLNSVRIQIVDYSLDDCYILFEGIKIDIHPNGDLSEWPKGFMDGVTRSFSELFQIKRRKGYI